VVVNPKPKMLGPSSFKTMATLFISAISGFWNPNNCDRYLIKKSQGNSPWLFLLLSHPLLNFKQCWRSSTITTQYFLIITVASQQITG
jgi:hypothetical protein